MQPPTNKSSLDLASVMLIELMQTLNFGRVERLQVRRGLPCLEPPPKVTQKLKIGGDNGSRPELAAVDFRLKNGVIELLEILARLGDGEILSIEVRNGLPVGVEIVWPDIRPWASGL